jgi:hypothetical protein
MTQQNVTANENATDQEWKPSDWAPGGLSDGEANRLHTLGD